MPFAIHATEVEIPESIRTNVAKHDTDHSGALSVEEYQLMLRKNTLRHLEKYDLKGEALTDKTNEVERSKFQKTDANGNGLVSLEEHDAYRAIALKRKQERNASEKKEES